jgi:sulfotransferase family protein/glycosyl transferase family 7 (putative galactosyltransferase)
MSTIVFATTCKGRAEHVKQTLPQNLADNPSPNSKFVLLDYSSQDGLAEWVRDTQMPAIEAGKLIYYFFPAPGAFRIAHAKNMAARCGMIEGADILVTLDADNFTGPQFDQFILDNLPAGEKGVFLCPDFAAIKAMPWGEGEGPLRRPVRGFHGRLAIRTQEFLKLGGYDEGYAIWGSEDVDLLGRLNRMHYEPRHIPVPYLHPIPHGADVRFKEYPEAKQNEGKWNIKKIGMRTETVVNYGQIGLGTVYRNFSSTPIELLPIPTRLFGIGLHKTATTSLHRAFQILGFDSLHWGQGEAPLIWEEMHAAGRSKTLERYYAACDLPIPLLYQKLDEAYPNSKFILTVRDEKKWLKSVERLWDPQYNPTRWEWDVWPISNRLHRALYGRADFNADVMLATYRNHNKAVQEYFKDRPQDLLVMDMDAWWGLRSAGWRQLCPFLGLPQPDCPYPHAYPTKLIETGGSL